MSLQANTNSIGKIQRSNRGTVGDGGEASNCQLAQGTSDGDASPNTVASAGVWTTVATTDTSADLSNNIIQQRLSRENLQPALQQMVFQTLVKEEALVADQNRQTAGSLSDFAAAAAHAIGAAELDPTAAGASPARDSGVALAALPGLLIACKIDNLLRILNHPMVWAEWQRGITAYHDLHGHHS